MMAKTTGSTMLSVDAICAKLKLNVDEQLPSTNTDMDNDIQINNNNETKIDESSILKSTKLTEDLSHQTLVKSYSDSNEYDQMFNIHNGSCAETEKDYSRKGDSTNSAGENVNIGFSNASSDTIDHECKKVEHTQKSNILQKVSHDRQSRKNRRKNFQPRCIYETPSTNSEGDKSDDNDVNIDMFKAFDSIDHHYDKLSTSEFEERVENGRKEVVPESDGLNEHPSFVEPTIDECINMKHVRTVTTKPDDEDEALDLTMCSTRSNKIHNNFCEVSNDKRSFVFIDDVMDLSMNKPNRCDSQKQSSISQQHETLNLNKYLAINTEYKSELSEEYPAINANLQGSRGMADASRPGIDSFEKLRSMFNFPMVPPSLIPQSESINYKSNMTPEKLTQAVLSRISNRFEPFNSSTSVTIPRSRPSDFISTPGSIPGLGFSERNALKDYAESTMNELLNIYGLRDRDSLQPDSRMITDPLFNFANGSANKRPDNHPVFGASYARGGNLRVNNSKASQKSSFLGRDKFTSSLLEGNRGFEYLPSLTHEADLDSSNSSRSSSHGASDDEDEDDNEDNSYGGEDQAEGASLSLRLLGGGNESESSMANFSTMNSKHSACTTRSTLSPRYIGNDYAKYVKRYNSFSECHNGPCQDKGYKEHFHCTACPSRICLKKEEMLRHFKWHKKREDSLQHGFMRYSPLDDCCRKPSTTISCPHNGRHTHYHCLQDGCSKVYISTSDVQMHANYHRKDSAIIQEGFQRYRATELCDSSTCTFSGQKTTHFHCCRPNCSFTFKNKADMEKHKTYHQKDELLSRDGFKKFMKYEECMFAGCRYSRVSNHIHCIRAGCNYVLHSTGQLYSHKRKHDRHEFEQTTFKRFKADETSSLDSPTADASILHSSLLLSSALKDNRLMSTDIPFRGLMKPKMEDVKSGHRNLEYMDIEEMVKLGHVGSSKAMIKPEKQSSTQLVKSVMEDPLTSPLSSPIVSPTITSVLSPTFKVKLESPMSSSCLSSRIVETSLSDSLNLPLVPPLRLNLKDVPLLSRVPMRHQPPMSLSMATITAVLRKGGAHTPAAGEKRERDESWKKYLTRYTANDPCHARCEFLYKDHYHCNQPRCVSLYKTKDGVREHAKYHEQQDRIKIVSFVKFNNGVKCSDISCPHNGHRLHYHCLWAGCKHVITDTDPVFSRLEHHKSHECAGRRSVLSTSLGGGTLALSSNSSTERRGGLSMWSASSSSDLKRKRGRPPKFSRSPASGTNGEALEDRDELMDEQDLTTGYRKYETIEPCPDDRCPCRGSAHFHCIHALCHFVAVREEHLNSHYADVHRGSHQLRDGFEFFDSPIDCRRSRCKHNRANRHFHCVRCEYSFIRHGTMARHARKHRSTAGGEGMEVSVVMDEGSSEGEDGPGSSLGAIKCGTIGELSTPARSRITDVGAAALARLVQQTDNLAELRRQLVENKAVESLNTIKRCETNETSRVIKSEDIVKMENYSDKSGNTVPTNRALGKRSIEKKFGLLSSTVTENNAVPGAGELQIPNISFAHFLNSGTLGAHLAAPSISVTHPISIPNTWSAQTASNLGMRGLLESRRIRENLGSGGIMISSGVVPTARIGGSQGTTNRPVVEPIAPIKVSLPEMFVPIVTTLPRFAAGSSVVSQTYFGSTNLLQGPTLAANTNETPVLNTIASGIQLGATASSRAEDVVMSVDPESSAQHFRFLSMASNLLSSTTINMGATIFASSPPITIGSVSSSSALPLSILLQQRPHNQALMSISGPSDASRIREHHGIYQNCGRPFCKLKKKDHYHCYLCNQASSDLTRLKAHVLTHGIKSDRRPLLGAEMDANEEGETTITVSPPQAQLETSQMETSINGFSPLKVVKKYFRQNPAVNAAEDGLQNMPREGKEIHEYESESDGSEGDKSDDVLHLEGIDREFRNVNSETFLPQCKNENFTQEIRDQRVRECSLESNSAVHHDTPLLLSNRQSPNTGDTDNVCDRNSVMSAISSTLMNDCKTDTDNKTWQSASSGVSSCHNITDGVGQTVSEINSVITIGNHTSSLLGVQDKEITLNGNIALPLINPIDSNIENSNLITETKSTDQDKASSFLNTPIANHPLAVSSTTLAAETLTTGPIDPMPTALIVSSEVATDPIEQVAPVEVEYNKYRFSEDCAVERCAYRLSMTHYHCLRADCAYSFCDLTRFTQHRDRHRRTDSIMAGSFQQFHAKTECSRGAECPHFRTTTHFHCLSCTFVCTDTGKVMAHRKHHAKMDELKALDDT